MNKISYEERATVYTDALQTFGPNMQMIVALEEMAELQKEITKALRGNLNPMHMAEEVADATIMLEQVRQMFNINEPVCEIMDHKIERLAHRVEDAKRQKNALLRSVFLDEETKRHREALLRSIFQDMEDKK